jgi:hypothetical protein
MREPYTEGVATPSGPESRGGVRKGVAAYFEVFSDRMR